MCSKPKQISLDENGSHLKTWQRWLVKNGHFELPRVCLVGRNKRNTETISQLLGKARFKKGEPFLIYLDFVVFHMVWCDLVFPTNDLRVEALQEIRIHGIQSDKARAQGFENPIMFVCYNLLFCCICATFKKSERIGSNLFLETNLDLHARNPKKKQHPNSYASA